MELMECPECEAVFGGPSLAAFGCCPACLGEQRFVRLRPCDAPEGEPPGPFRAMAPGPPPAAAAPPLPLTAPREVGGTA